jgi:hypothetical protein
MSAIIRHRPSAATLILVVLAAGPLLAADRFRAIQPRLGGAPGRDMIRVTVSISEYTTAEEARSLQQAAARGGRAAMLDELRTKNHGSVSITGSGRSVIYSAHTDRGGSRRRILIVCSRSPLPDSGQPAAATDAVRVIELQVDERGEGDGRLIDAATVSLDDHGFAEVEQPLAVPTMLVEVRPDK